MGSSSHKKHEVKTPTPFTQERAQRSYLEQSSEMKDKMQRTLKLHNKLHRQAKERKIAILDEESEISSASSPLIQKAVRFSDDTPQVKLLSPAASQLSEFESASRREDKRIRESAKDKIMRCAEQVEQFRLPLKKADILYEREYGAIKTRALMKKMQKEDDTLLNQEISQLRRNQELLKDEIASLKRQEERTHQLQFQEYRQPTGTQCVESNTEIDEFKLNTREQQFLQEWRSLSQKQKNLIESTEMGRKLNQSRQEYHQQQYISDSQQQEEWVRKFDKLEKMQKKMIQQSNTLEFDAKMSAAKEKEALERKTHFSTLSLADDNISKVNGSYGGTLDEADFSKLDRSKLSFFGTARQLNFSRTYGLRTLSSTSDLRISRQELGLRSAPKPPVQNRESGLAGIEAQIANMRSYFKQRRYQEQVMQLNQGNKVKTSSSLARPPRIARRSKQSMDLNRIIHTPSRILTLSSGRPMRGSVTRMSINTNTSLLSYNAKVLSARTPVQKNKEAYLNILRGGAGGSPSPIWKPSSPESPMSCNSPLFSEKFDLDSVELRKTDL